MIRQSRRVGNNEQEHDIVGKTCGCWGSFANEGFSQTARRTS